MFNCDFISFPLNQPKTAQKLTCFTTWKLERVIHHWDLLLRIYLSRSYCIIFGLVHVFGELLKKLISLHFSFTRKSVKHMKYYYNGLIFLMFLLPLLIFALWSYFNRLWSSKEQKVEEFWIRFFRKCLLLLHCHSLEECWPPSSPWLSSSTCSKPSYGTPAINK